MIKINEIFFTFLGFVKVGGYDALIEKYFASMPNTTRFHLNHPAIPYNYTDCGLVPDNSMHLLRAADDGSLPWPGVIFGLTISSIWYWCSDQVDGSTFQSTSCCYVAMAVYFYLVLIVVALFFLALKRTCILMLIHTG